MLIDLQLHSTYSDGYLAPRELAKFVARQGIKTAALTDHDTVGGLGEFRRACQQYKIKPITGLELYTKLKSKRFNLLWYNFDDKNPELHAFLRNIQIRRRGQVRRVLKKLVKCGFKININKILDKYNHYVPLNHIVDEIWSVSTNRAKIKKDLKNKKPRQEEIIGAYFYNKKIGRLHEARIDIKRILNLRKKIGGQIILNHPGRDNRLEKNFLTTLKRLGVDGIEVLSPHHSIGAVMCAQFMAEELGFIMTGGSDFHLFEGEKRPTQNSWNYFKIDSKFLKGLNKIIG